MLGETLSFGLPGNNINYGYDLSTSPRVGVIIVARATGGKSVNINVGNNLHNKGAVVANVDADGVDQGNLNINVGGAFTHEDIADYDNSVTRGAGVSVGVNPSKDTGGVSGVSGTYADHKKEGITRATIGEGTITVAGLPLPVGEGGGEGLNRDITNTQETTFEEGMDVTLNVPMELVIDPAGYLATSANSSYIGQIRALVGGDRNYMTVQIEGLSEEQRQDIISGKISAKASKEGDTTYITLSTGERYVANVQNYTYAEIMENPGLVQGQQGLFLNGIMNSPEDAIRNGLMQTGQGQFVVAYDPTYGIIPDLIEVGYNKFIGNTLPTANVIQDNAFLTLFNQQNPGAIDAAHSAGGQRLYLALEANSPAFANALLQFSGAPVNEGNVQRTTRNVINGYVLQNNPGDFVGGVLGNNAKGSEWVKSTVKFPLLFTPLSPHSNYRCTVCQQHNK